MTSEYWWRIFLCYTLKNGYQKHKKSYYEALGVAQDADLTTIKKAYRKLCLTHHPDKTDDTQKHKLFIYISKAWEILSDDQSRAGYDQAIAQITGQNAKPSQATKNSFFKPTDAKQPTSVPHPQQRETVSKRTARKRQSVSHLVNKFAKQSVSFSNWLELGKRLSHEDITYYRHEAMFVNGILDFLETQSNLDDKTKAQMNELLNCIPEKKRWVW